ncbi:DNA polymerase IV [Polyangium sorediatum]|uniref:DNA polymerase IV n=1 Tax=Polyangium sorediatum TaxID=889274 RepID=A0ABT6P8I8_9BACT|nr:DNA polymerase IV [Polyangium sorediatum]MDI1436898.1 DNA polymerase IV [Polyangium sorediatum]
MSRVVLHVDMDAFYASVEQRDDPRLRGRPVIVGGHPRRGVVLAASYEVRPFGVRSAMPMARALVLAPSAIVVPPRFSAYAEASEQIHAIFESVTPLVEPLSLDEAFLDVTASRALFGTGEAIATHIRARIAEEVRLPASAGVASSKLVAKIASDLAKPNGQRVVPHEDTTRFLAPLPVSRLWGVGPKTEEILRAQGLHTIGDVAARDPISLGVLLGKLGPHIHALATGRGDDRPVVPDREQKSLGAEDTFEEDQKGAPALAPHVHAQALRVGRRLRRAGLVARAVVLKIKLSDHTLFTRRTTLDEPTDDGAILHRAALALLDGLPLSRRVRLTGVSAHELSRGGGQLPLFDQGAQRSKRLNQVLDRIADRFGPAAIVPADVASLGQGSGADDEARRKVGAARFDAPSPLSRRERGRG